MHHYNVQLQAVLDTQYLYVQFQLSITYRVGAQPRNKEQDKLGKQTKCVNRHRKRRKK